MHQVAVEYSVEEVRSSGAALIDLQDGPMQSAVEREGAAPSLEVRSLHYARNETPLLHQLSLCVYPCRWLPLLGANGTGKSTLLRILCGLLQAQHGEILWDGSPITKVRQQFYSSITYIGHKFGLKGGWTVRQNLSFFQQLKTNAHDATCIFSAAKFFAVAQLLDTTFDILSSGQSRRVALCRLLTEPARLWLLDEPFRELDERGRQCLGEALAEHLQRGGSAIIATHTDTQLSLPGSQSPLILGG